MALTFSRIFPSVFHQARDPPTPGTLIDASVWNTPFDQGSVRRFDHRHYDIARHRTSLDHYPSIEQVVDRMSSVGQGRDSLEDCHYLDFLFGHRIAAMHDMVMREEHDWRSSVLFCLMWNSLVE